MIHLSRQAGILLHITSLPSDFGIGDLGAGARQFVDFLQSAGHHLWQVLPLGPTIQSDSPYSCYSAFAGNPLLVDLEALHDEQLLSQTQLEELRLPGGGQTNCDFDAARRIKWQGLRTAFEEFRRSTSCSRVDEFEAFCVNNRSWLDDFCLFAALMKHFGNDNWPEWGDGIVQRDSATLGNWKDQLAIEFEFEQFVQYVFRKQWTQLTDYAASRDVTLFGDMPIFVAHGSADVWANQDLFLLKEDGRPSSVAGVPPDYFSKDGQLWGNPLYNWDAMERDNYRWWTNRLRDAFQAFGLLRIDHFRGFESYWSVPAGARTAKEGTWEPGPGVKPFRAAEQAIGPLAIIAEDLGLITEEVHQLRDELQFPGMRVLQFGFDADHDHYHRPDDYVEDSVAYTGTHDNSTILGWYESRQSNPKTQELLEPYLQRTDPTLPLHQRLMSLVYGSTAQTAIIPMQDALGLDDSAKMNTPGQAFGNWTWRCQASQLTDAVAEQLQHMSCATGRATSTTFVV